MARFSTFRYIATLSFFVLSFKIVTADPNSSFHFKNFGNDSNFESQLTLYGNAKLVDGGSSVQFTGSSISNGGRVMFKKPIKLVEGNPRKSVSFSTEFSVSMSPEKGEGLAFVIVPIGFPLNLFDGGSFGMLGERRFRVLGVEFDTLKDDMYGDLNGNHIGIDVSSLVSVKVSNVSFINLVLNSGDKLQAWIDYEAGSNQLEVRLGRLGDTKPVDPFLSYPIDLSSMWEEQEVFVGLSSLSRNSSQKCNVYSWSFNLRRVPDWMHSQPLDPKAFEEKTKSLTVHERGGCLLRVLAALIFGTGCGAAGTFLVLFVWSIFGNRRPVVPEEYAVHPVEFEQKRFKVVDKSIENGKQ